MLMQRAARVRDRLGLVLAALGPRGTAFAHGDGAHAVITIFQMLVLVLPAAGMLYTTTRVARRFGAAALPGPTAASRGAGGCSRVAGSHGARHLLPCGRTAATARSSPGSAAPSPARPAARAAPTGRPALTPVREEQLGGAPTQRQLQRRTGGELGTGSTQPTAGSPQHVRAVHPSPPTSWDTPDPATRETPPSSTYVAPDSQPAPPPTTTTTTPTQTTPTQTTPTQTTPTQTTPTQTTPTDTTPTDTTPTDTTPTDTTPTQTTPPPSP